MPDGEPGRDRCPVNRCFLIVIMSKFLGYRVDHNGRTKGPSGTLYVYKAGDLVPCPDGELDHLGHRAVKVYESGDADGASQTAAMTPDLIETRPVKPALRKSSGTKRRRASTAKKE